METNKIFRHGDLVINKVETTDASLNKAKEIILAEGEHTGHKHLLKAIDKTTQIEFARELDKITFKVEGGQALLVHEEHAQITFDPGIYTVVIKREFDYFADQIKKVLD